MTSTAMVSHRHIQQSGDFESPFDREEFTLVLLQKDCSVAPAERARIASQIVAQGCRYAIACGNECSLWDDAIDLAYLEKKKFVVAEHEPDFVMTTWHENQLIEDVICYAATCAWFDDYLSKRFVVVQIGGPVSEVGAIAARLQEMTA